MALTTCPDCGTKVSTKARACPHCGRGIKLFAGYAGPVMTVAIVGFVLWYVFDSSAETMRKVREEMGAPADADIDWRVDAAVSDKLTTLIHLAKSDCVSIYAKWDETPKKTWVWCGIKDSPDRYYVAPFIIESLGDEVEQQYSVRRCLLKGTC